MTVYAIAVGAVGYLQPHISGQVIAPAFATDYSLIDLGLRPGSTRTLWRTHAEEWRSDTTLLLGGGANAAGAGVYAIGVVRDLNSHIIGFTGSATLFSTAPNIDGGLAYGPDGVLFYTGYPINTLGQIKPGSTTPDKIINLSPLGISSSVGTVMAIL
jgi:hypothetical protein